MHFIHNQLLVLLLPNRLIVAIFVHNMIHKYKYILGSCMPILAFYILSVHVSMGMPLLVYCLTILTCMSVRINPAVISAMLLFSVRINPLVSFLLHILSLGG